MSYSDQLNPWCIARLLPDMQRTVVNRFRRRNDAEAYLKLLRQMMPTATYTIVFDLAMDPLEPRVSDRFSSGWV